jgi:tRNA(Ile)-lysidine synthase
MDLTPRFAALAEDVLPAPGSRLLLAVSGGADSVALWDLCARVGRWPLTIWHLDHRLRHDSAADEVLLRARAARGGEVDLRCESADIAALARGWRCGLEAAGRRQRYERLAAVAREVGAAAVLTAHHRDDQAETVLANLLRGAGPVGRGGIAPRRDLGGVPLVRPLLGFGREDLRAHLATHGIAWMEDATNGDLRFTRNALRHRVLPTFEQLAPGFAAALADLADDARRRHADEIEAAARLWREGAGAGTLAIAAVLGEPEGVRYLVWRDLVRELGAPLGRRHLRQLDVLARGPVGRRYHLGKHLLTRRRDAIAWQEARPTVAEAGSLEIPECGRWVRGAGTLTCITSRLPADPEPPTPFEAFVDRAALSWPLWWRQPHEGERFRPLGCPGSQPVAKYLAGRGVPSRLRPLIAVIADADGIVWIPGFGVAERAKIRPATVDVLHLVYEQHGPAPAG